MLYRALRVGKVASRERSIHMRRHYYHQQASLTRTVAITATHTVMFTIHPTE
jgi:hypothetical protein